MAGSQFIIHEQNISFTVVCLVMVVPAIQFYLRQRTDRQTETDRQQRHGETDRQIDRECVRVSV